ncbi:unnamed protein product [Effrenium voratum]|uniref:Uncharacterized protein n=1 Tax=Effrenium voratum TaxID=2562239 RepID=A0AA36I9Q2_9DINO|nr:unnamed protein product [Effrenium voratum]
MVCPEHLADFEGRLGKDRHVLQLLLQKLGLAPPEASFDAFLYLQAPEFQVLSYNHIREATTMLALPFAGLAALLVALNWLRGLAGSRGSRSHKQGARLLQIFFTLALCLVALLVSRLRVLAAPALCLAASLCASPDLLGGLGRPGVVLAHGIGLLLLSPLQGGVVSRAQQVSAIQDDLDMRELVEWANATLGREVILLADMTMAAKLRMISPHLRVGNHPQYESLTSRQRNRDYYRTFSCASPARVFKAVNARMTQEAEPIDAHVPKPVLPSRFHVTFQEYTRGMHPWGKGATNAGALHYDFEKLRALWRHGKGQTDNWCQCAGLKTDEQCDLLALPETKTLVALFRTLSPASCCTIGNWSQGFGPLRPDWLVQSNASLVGTSNEGNRTCYEWASDHPGDWFTMISDNWALDAHGIPCTYEDKFKRVFRLLGLKHQLTFDLASYDTSPEPDEMFAVPAGVDCSKKCPNKEGWCKGG